MTYLILSGIFSKRHHGFKAVSPQNFGRQKAAACLSGHPCGFDHALCNEKPQYSPRYKCPLHDITSQDLHRLLFIEKENRDNKERVESIQMVNVVGAAFYAKTRVNKS